MTEAHQNNATPSERFSRLRKWAEDAGVAAIISLVVSAGISVYFESRLENSKNRYAAIMHQKDQFDASQNTVFVELGLYTGRVLDNNDPRKRDQLDAAIIGAQLQANSLASELSDKNRLVVDDYERKLDSLRRQIQAVSGAKDLSTVYISAQEVLKSHNEIGEELNKNLKVSIFY